jgi:hypothetical protein
MKRNKSVLVCILLLALVASSAASAHGFRGSFHHSHARVGVFVGVPLAGAYYYGPRYYYPPPYYYYPSAPIALAPASPPVYVEQADQQTSAQLPANYWYYCNNPQGYYPTVKECPAGWQRVAPQPPSHP